MAAMFSVRARDTASKIWDESIVAPRFHKAYVIALIVSRIASFVNGDSSVKTNLIHACTLAFIWLTTYNDVAMQS